MSARNTGHSPLSTRRTHVWFWRSGYPWEVGFTVKRDRRGFSIGVRWPIYQRCSWGGRDD